MEVIFASDKQIAGVELMAYGYGNRDQQTFLPASIEEYVDKDAPVWAYDAFVEALDFSELGIELDDRKVGNSSYDPKAMLKLLVYGYAYGVRSSRKLERETHYNMSFIWLTGGLKPDHKTIAEFRCNNRTALSRVLRQCARLCLELDLVAGNTLFVDGSNIAANASLRHHWSKSRCRKRLQKIDRRIEEILSECERVDSEEAEVGSLVKLREELADQQARRQKIEGILRQLRSSDKAWVNTTDPECVSTKGRQGFRAGYKMQSVVDEKHGLIVQADVVAESHDTNELRNQVKRAQETLGEVCETVCADSGYANYDEMEKLEDEGIKVIVPSRRQANRQEPKPFEKSQFEYDREKDVYVCPAGKLMTYRGIEKGKRKIYRAGGSVCRQCCHFGRCTKAGKNGRKIVRYLNEEFRESMAAQYQQPESQEIYKLRKEKAELPFALIKWNLKAGHFLLRGLSKVKAEASLLASCFNLVRMINLLGVPKLTAKLLT